MIQHGGKRIPPDADTIFLDRDGVLNEKMPEGQYVGSWIDFHVLPGVPEALARLNRSGFRVIVVTNQRGISLGRYTPADVESIHAGFQRLLQSYGAHVDAFYFCPHDKGECGCRKPQPGLFEQARKEFSTICAARSVMIGDTPSDIEFGRRLGMTTIQISGKAGPSGAAIEQANGSADLQCASLAEAVDRILMARS